MASLLAIERFLPPYRYDQDEVTRWVRDWLSEGDGAAAARLLSVYASAGVATPGQRRAHRGGLPAPATSRPRTTAIARSPRDGRRRPRAPRPGRRRARARREVGLIVSVSCTGFMIPAVDAYVADALGMGPRLVRLPITESGCAGGVVGLARAARLPGRPSRPRRARPRPRVREPHLPALGPLRHQRRLHRDLRRRRRGGGAGGRRASARAGGRPGARGGRGEHLLPRHHPPHGLPPAQPGAADHPRPRAGPVRAAARSWAAVDGFLARAA